MVSGPCPPRSPSPGGMRRRRRSPEGIPRILRAYKFDRFWTSTTRPRGPSAALSAARHAPAPARVPKPVDAETVRQFVAPSLDEMLVADMAAREDAEGGFDQRNANTFNVKAYQKLVPRHLVDWGEPGSERPREETNELVTRLDTTVSVHVLPERRRALPLSPEEWVCRAAMDPNHPATAFDATTVPTLLRLLVPRRAAEVTVIDGDLANDNNRAERAKDHERGRRRHVLSGSRECAASGRAARGSPAPKE